MESTLTALKQKIGDFYTEVRTGQWTDYSPQTLVHELKQAKNHLNEIQTSLNSNQNPAEFSDLEKEVHQMIELLSRNIELEEQKGMHDFSSINETEVQGNAEHVWDIQRKLIGLALKTKLKLSENTGIQTREDLKKMYGKQASNTLAELLNQREDELIHLQKEFHELNRKSYLGLIQEKSLADHEEDWTQTRVDLEKMKELLEHGFNEYGKQMMRLQKSFFELKREKNKLEHALDKFGEKNTELVQGLKKERDYSKKILIQSLPETMKLRKMYSKEIMKLEHAKIRIQKEQREKFGKALERLRRELKDKTELQKYFQELASQKDNQMSALEEKNQELRLAFKTAEKHEKVLRGQLKGLEKWAEENGWDEEETKNKPKKLKKKKKQ